MGIEASVKDIQIIKSSSSYFQRCTGCVTKMYPIFESEQLIAFSRSRNAFYTVVKRTEFCTELYKLQVSNVMDFDIVRPPK